MSGMSGDSFFWYGLPRRTGHFCIRVTFTLLPFGVSMTATVSVTVYSPAEIERTVPSTPAGTRILWTTISVSCTVPRTSPPTTASPTCTAGRKFHFASRFSEGTSTPRFRLLPEIRMIASSGRWMPS